MANSVLEDFFLARLRVGYHDLIRNEPVGLGYKSAGGDFFRPALMGNRLQFAVLAAHIGRMSVIFFIHCAREIEEITCCRLVMATIALNTHNAVTNPRSLKDALTACKESCR